MCGISGIISPEGLKQDYEKELRAALYELRFRGPDHQEFFQNSTIAIAHSRLSIIDTSSNGNQPFFSADRQQVIVLNGELFNYRELRSELEKEGCVFLTQSDTEVMLQGFHRYKEKFLHKIHGFFAFHFSDLSTNEHWLVRDRFGEKPIYWSYKENTCFYASDFQSILAFPIEKTIHQQALHHYLHLSYIPAPYTMLNQVHKLQPGELLYLGKQGIKNTNWYTLKGDVNSDEIQLKNALQEAVKWRMVADVPLGSFLSGGLDSAIVSALACQLKPQLHTYSISFPKQAYFDESRLAERTAKKIGSRHHFIPVDLDGLSRDLDEILESFTEPFGDSSSILMYVLSREVKKDITVALSGDGADELFGGYTKHRALLRSIQSNWSNHLLKSSAGLLKKLGGNRNSSLGNNLRKISKYAEGLHLPVSDRYFQWAGFSNEKLISSILQSGKNAEYLAMKSEFVGEIKKGTLHEMLVNDIHLVLPNDMLYKVDLMSMRHGLEVRSPFLDHRVMELAMGINIERKINSTQGKVILRELFRDQIDEEVLKGKKKGFEIPLQYWIDGPLSDRIKKDWFSKEKLERGGLFDSENVIHLLKNTSANAHLIWNIMVFQHWYFRNLA